MTYAETEFILIKSLIKIPFQNWEQLNDTFVLTIKNFTFVLIFDTCVLSKVSIEIKSNVNTTYLDIEVLPIMLKEYAFSVYQFFNNKKIEEKRLNLIEATCAIDDILTLNHI